MMFGYGSGWPASRGEIDAEEYQRLRDLIAPGTQASRGSGSGR